MRHRKAGRKLSRTGAHREAMLRNMVTSLFIHEKIKTTDAKAKELKGLADKMVTLAKRGDVHARRQALAVIRDRKVVKKLFENLRERFVDRSGGYTSITRIGLRRGDAAPVSLVELVGTETRSEKTKGKKGKGAAKARGKAPKAATAKSAPAKKEKAEEKKKSREEKAEAKPLE